MINEPDNWNGQKKINGNLCRVDWRLIQALIEVSNLLKSSGADTSNLDALIAAADEIGATVALETPPGCEGARTS
jgi:hypothetical protein